MTQITILEPVLFSPIQILALNLSHLIKVITFFNPGFSLLNIDTLRKVDSEKQIPGVLIATDGAKNIAIVEAHFLGGSEFP